MKKKQVIRLTESDLHNIIKESVKNILKENDERYMNVKLSDCIKKLIKQGYSQQKAQSLIRKAINNNEWKYLQKIIFDKN
jgi:DNA-binding transcriptional regulator YhcF (GntR family)